MTTSVPGPTSAPGSSMMIFWRSHWLTALLVAAAVLVPFVGIYPIFVMKALCFALLAASFNLLFGYAGLLSFGHAAFFGTAAYVTAYKIGRASCRERVSVLV